MRADDAAAADLPCSAAYSGAALAFRDRLVVDWNKTQQRQTLADQKRVYCECPVVPASRAR